MYNLKNVQVYKCEYKKWSQTVRCGSMCGSTNIRNQNYGTS
jgi:hypothetical protein